MIQQFDNRWTEDRPLRHIDCQLCGNAQSFPIHRENGFTVVRCTSCAFVFVNPRPGEDDLAVFYQKYYPHDEAAEESWGSMMGKIFRDARDRIVSTAPAGRVLDVGCGLGYFVAQFKDTGWEAVGVDLSADVAERARSRNGVDVRPGELTDQGFKDGSFDAVTLFYLLEHSPDPASVLREVHRILKPGGLVLIRVPHMEPLIRLRAMFGAPRTFFHPPMHLCDLGPKVLAKLLKQLGFESIRTTIGGATSPPNVTERIVSRMAGALASVMEVVSGGTALLPGVSKTTLARKPS